MKQTIEALLHSLNLPSVPEWLDLAVTLSKVSLIIVLAWLLFGVAKRLIRLSHVRLRAREEGPEELRRIDTLERVFTYALTVIVSVIVVMLVLSEFGISIAPLLATAGVAGLAIGFGAQSLVKDYFTGFVMLIENQIRVGDVVEVSGKAGVVQELTLRYVQLRDYEGSVHYVPNGTIVTVTNRSRGFAYAVMDTSIAYKEDIDRVYAVMQQTAAELRSDPEFALLILEDLEISGVDQWAESAVIIKSRIKTMALEQWKVRRAYLRRLKFAFDRHGIEIPFPQRTVHTIPAQSADGGAAVARTGVND
jgi:small-conductance mechanosensitive channel